MADPLNESMRLRAEFEQTRIDLITTDLGVCLTLADIAATEYGLGNREHAEQAVAEAEKGYSDMLRFFSEATGMTAEVETGLQSKFQAVRQRLDELKPLR